MKIEYMNVRHSRKSRDITFALGYYRRLGILPSPWDITIALGYYRHLLEQLKSIHSVLVLATSPQGVIIDTNGALK
jgi:hypothetical protein